MTVLTSFHCIVKVRRRVTTLTLPVRVRYSVSCSLSFGSKVKLNFVGHNVMLFLSYFSLSRYLQCGACIILGDPGAVSRVGRKGGRKVFITGETAPGYRLSPDHFQKFKRMPAPDWAQKMLCIIVPNRRTHLHEFFWCVRT